MADDIDLAEVRRRLYKIAIGGNDALAIQAGRVLLRGAEQKDDAGPDSDLMRDLFHAIRQDAREERQDAERAARREEADLSKGEKSPDAQIALVH